MNTLQLAFNYETFPVRTISDTSGIWFVLRDVCISLGIADDKQVYDRLDDDERGRYKVPTPGGMQEMRCVNEAGLYEVIIRSNSEKAKPFRRWVTHDVLPSIRKQGYYSLMSDKDLLDVIIEKQRQNSEFLNKIDKTAIKSKLLSESRVSKIEQTEILFLSKSEYDVKSYRIKLKEIWGDDNYGFHKNLDEYMKWYNKIGFKIVGCTV